jgi:hypothetical protein
MDKTGDMLASPKFPSEAGIAALEAPTFVGGKEMAPGVVMGTGAPRLGAILISSNAGATIGTCGSMVPAVEPILDKSSKK